MDLGQFVVDDLDHGTVNLGRIAVDQCGSGACGETFSIVGRLRRTNIHLGRICR